MGEPLTHVAVDIETTGVAASDVVTVIGFEVELGCRVFYQTGGREPTLRAASIGERTGTDVRLSGVRSETELLEAVVEFAASRLRSADVVLVGYNGETWNGGFDLPFLRTRYAACDVAWPFRGVPYADLLPVVQQLFNTHVDGEDPAGLDAVYDILCDGDAGAADPFAASSEAVTAFSEGRIEDVVVHNVADLVRTAAVSRLAQRYCSKSDFDLKSLTPTVPDAENQHYQ